MSRLKAGWGKKKRQAGPMSPSSHMKKQKFADEECRSRSCEGHMERERHDKNQNPKALYLKAGSFHRIELPFKQDTQQKVMAAWADPCGRVI